MLKARERQARRPLGKVLLLSAQPGRFSARRDCPLVAPAQSLPPAGGFVRAPGSLAGAGPTLLHVYNLRGQSEPPQRVGLL